MRKATNNLIEELANSGTNGLRDIKPPVHIPSGWEWLWWVLVLLLLSALAYLAWRYWRRRKDLQLAPVVVPAHIRARQKLQRALDLIHNPKEFCILVSDTVRSYLEERFQFRAPERTTEEFLRELGDTSLLTRDQKQGLARFLEACDLAKFAKYEPQEPELRDLHASALRLVEETVPVSPTPTADAGSLPAKMSETIPPEM